MSKEESESSLLAESNKWKKFEEHVLLLISNCKNNCKGEEVLIKTLEKKVDNLSNSRSDLTEKVKSEMYNKYFSTHDVFKLGGLSDHISNSCDEVKRLLETCNKLQQKCKCQLNKLKHKLHQRKISNENIIKSQNNELQNLENEKKNTTHLLIAEQKQQSLELNPIKQLQEATENELQLLKCNQHKEYNADYEDEIKNLESNKLKIKEALTKKIQRKEMILTSAADLEIKTDQEIELLNDKINVILKKYEDVNFNIEENKKLTEEQENNNNCSLEENIKLEFDSKSIQEKSSELDLCIIEMDKEFLQNKTELTYSINVLKSNILDKKQDLLKEKETETACSSTEENYKNDLERKIETLNSLESNLNELHIQKNNLIESDNAEIQLIETSSKTYEQSSTQVQTLKSDIQEIGAAISNSTLACESTIEKLIKEIEDLKSSTDMKNKDLEAEKLKYYAEKDAARSDEIMNYDTETKKIENELNNIKKLIETMIEQKEQTFKNLESRTLECNILKKKINTAEGIQTSLKEELKPKPTINLLPIFPNKRHLDDTSDSSFDGNITFPQRMLMKKKIKRSKTAPTKII